MTPALTIKQKEIDEAVSIVKKAFKKLEDINNTKK
jgi:acetylornithine/succinyldiaminopimelate/putrescine aminotransferase